MSLFTRFSANIFNTAQRFSSTILTKTNTNNFHSVTNTSQTLVPGGFFPISVRNKIRCYFPKPSERKRIKRHGFWTRMSTLGGRRVLMRRILKGRHVLSH